MIAIISHPLRVFVILLLLAAGLSLSPTPAWGAEAAPAADNTRVFFATDRMPSGRSEPARFFGERWGALSFGVCGVRVPPRSRRGRSDARTRAYRTPGRPSKRVRLMSLEPMARDSFFRAIQQPGDSTNVLVFVHGYNVRFETAARFIAQITTDLGFRGTVILYSWPATPRYLSDEETVECAGRHLEDFLTALEREPVTVNLMTYSMGSRALVGALHTLAATAEPGRAPRLDHVIIVAADVDARLFALQAEEMSRLARRVTLYASSRDRILNTSRKVHRHSRAGEAGRVTAPGVDVVDVSRIRADMMGHGYLEELVQDLHGVLVEDLPPDRRPGLQRSGDGADAVWKLTRRR